MNMDERIKRINELYHKSQNEGLTDEEKLEQTILRQEYVDSIKRNMKAQSNTLFFPKLPPQVGHFSSAEDTLDPQNSQVNSKFS